MRKINKMDDAVVGIIATFLITGLIVIVISLIQTVYVPKWMEQNEADHMEVVSDQFSQLKFAIDTQSALQQTNIPISTSITLGNKEMPFLMSSRSYGSLEVTPDECIVTFNDDPDFSYPIGIIKYSSVNSYFLNQEYVYEAGALILSQTEGNTISIRPAFSVYKGDEIDISITLINITTIGEQQSISGYGSYPIQTEYLDPEPVTSITIDDVSNIAITTGYQNSWVKFIKNTLINAGLEEKEEEGDTGFTIDIDGNKVFIDFEEMVETVNVDLTIININAQITPGRIENVR